MYIVSINIEHQKMSKSITFPFPPAILCVVSSRYFIHKLVLR